MRTTTQLWVVAVLMWLHVGVASAADRIALHVEGKAPGFSAQQIRDELRLLLPPDREVVDHKTFRVALYRRGMRGELGKVITVPRLRGITMRMVQRAMRGTKADTAIIGRLRRSAKQKPELYLLVLRPDGKVEGDVVIPLRKEETVARLAALREPLASALGWDDGGDLAPAKPKDPIPEPDPPKPTIADTPVEEPSLAEANMAAFKLMAGYRVAGRKFSYSNPKTFNLRPFDQFGAHMAWVGFEAFPFDRIPVAEYFGIFGDYGLALGLESSLPNGRVASNTFDQLRTGLRLRLRTGAPPAPVLSARGTFGWLRYRFSSEDNPFFTQLPDVWYVFGGGGVDMRLPLWRFTIFGGADYLAPLSGGVVSARFRDTSIVGLNARAGVSVQLIDELELSLAADYTTMFYFFEPQPLDEFVATKARDEVLAAEVGLVYLYH